MKSLFVILVLVGFGNGEYFIYQVIPTFKL